MAKKKYKIQLIDEHSGIVVFVSADDENPIEDGRRMFTKISGNQHSGTFRNGQCWIFTRKAFGPTFSITHT